MQYRLLLQEGFINFDVVFFMKKPKLVDVFRYTKEEFEDWWERSVKKMMKHAQKRESRHEMKDSLRTSRKLSRQQPREMERA
jgi:hypothetical protein